MSVDDAQLRVSRMGWFVACQFVGTDDVGETEGKVEGTDVVGATEGKVEGTDVDGDAVGRPVGGYVYHRSVGDVVALVGL